MPATSGYTFGTSKVSSGGGGGPLGFVTHLLGKTASNLEEAAINSIPGFYHLTGGLIHHPLSTLEDMGQQMLTDFEHPLRNPGYTLLDALALVPVLGVPARVGRIAAIGARAGELPAELATSELAAKAGRSAEYNRIVNPKTGEVNPVGKQISTEIFRGLPPEERILRIPGDDVLNQEGLTKYGWMFSRDPLIRKAQKMIDRQYETFPEGTPPPVWRAFGGPAFWRTQAGRINSAGKAQNLINRLTSRSKAAQFLAAHGARPDEEHAAARMVAEMTLPEDRLKFHQEWLDSGALSPFLRDETVKTMETIQNGSKFVEPKQITLPNGETHTVPVIKAEFPELQQYVDAAREISNDRTLAARMAGVLTGESHYRRTAGPLNLILHGKIPDNIASLRDQLQRQQNLGNKTNVAKLQKQLDEAYGQLTLDGLSPKEELIQADHAQQLVDAAGGFRVPYKPLKGQSIDFGSTSFRRAYRGGKPKAPGTFTHPFTGGYLKHGGGDPNTARLLAESYTEAHRFIGLRNARDFLLASAKDTPEGIPPEFRRLIATDELIKGGRQNREQALEFAQTNPEKQFLDKGGLTPEETVAGGRLYEGLRKSIFPEDLPKEIWRKLTGKDGQTYRKVAGYKWIDSRLLGGLDKQNPLFGAYESKATRTFIHTADILNNVQKAQLLYLKPAYAIPNMLGNVALTLVQQGFMAPFYMARSFKLYRDLLKEDPATLAAIKGAVGQGFSTSVGKSQGELSARAASKVVKGGNWLANSYGKLIDDPFRFASFLHEADMQGFRSASELKSLVNDPEFVDQFHQVATRANDALINYERLGPGEEAFVRRLVFFYPWIKGASRYAAQFPKEHPLAAGLHGIAGQTGTQQIEEFLGHLPVFAEGLIPFRHDNPDFPEVVNPSSASILGEPATLAKMITNVIQKNPNPDLPASAHLAPIDAFLLALITAGSQTTLGHPGSERAIVSAFHEATGGSPIVSLLNSLRGKAASGGELDKSLYPDPSWIHAVSRFGALGGLTPRVYSRAAGEKKFYRETHPSYVG